MIPSSDLTCDSEPSYSSFVSPLAQNNSCSPFSSPTSQCNLGNYPVYVVNASSSDHVAATINFAKKNNIRLIVKSTGHDLLGKSSGADSLSIWVHNLKGLSFTDRYAGLNTYNNYHGPAARIEPGLMSYEIYQAAHSAGYRVIGGTCNTVAIGGGFTQGGGHSLLSSKYGLSADNVLEWEVVTADGRHITATPSQHSDLYWALSGGGPGVWAVVMSVTLKVFPDGPIAAAGITFSISTSPSEDAFWRAIHEFHKLLPGWMDQNATAPYFIASGAFFLQPLTLPDRPVQDVTALVQPFVDTLNELNITHTLNVTSFPSFLTLFANYYGPMPYGIYTHSQTQVSRLMPRSALLNRTSDLIAAYRKIAALPSGLWILGNGMHTPREPSAAAANSVLPAWRDADIQQIVLHQWDWNATWETEVAKDAELRETVLPLLVELSPGSGTYMNEGNVNQGDWKEAFYGENYGRLAEIKRTWDPSGVFFSHTGVGSDEWVTDRQGRLCKA
jgi:FAD/FMN-containing dehydrogenase